MNDRFTLASILTCILMLTGCNSGGSTSSAGSTSTPSGATIVGNWTGTIPSIMGKAQPVSVKFGSDGTYTETPQTSGIVLETDGTYQYNAAKSQLQMKMVSMGTPGGPKGKASYDSGVQFAWNPVQWNGSREITIKTQMGDWHLKKG